MNKKIPDGIRPGGERNIRVTYETGNGVQLSYWERQCLSCLEWYPFPFVTARKGNCRNCIKAKVTNTDIKWKLVDQCKNLTPADIPKELIDTKRLTIILKQKVYEQSARKKT